MMRWAVEALSSLILRVFFRHVDVVGAENVPAEGPIIFALNHPNGLVDGIFLVDLAPRRIIYLAKAPVFNIPIIGTFARALECLPVYRKVDGADTSKNRLTFEQARTTLAKNHALGIFPEGASHSDPSMRRFKTGAARIALATQSLGTKSTPRVCIVPAGLYYTEKRKFRSNASLIYGPPIHVEDVTLDAEHEPPRDAVKHLTHKIRVALERVTLQAESEVTLELARLTEKIIGPPVTKKRKLRPIAASFRLRRRFVDRYQAVRQNEPDRVDAVSKRLRDLKKQCNALGLSTTSLARHPSAWRRIEQALQMFLWSIFGLPGFLWHYPTFRLTEILALRMSGTETDLIATIKILSSLALIPITWIIGSGIAAFFWGPLEAFAMLACGPLFAFTSIRFTEVASLWLQTERLAWLSQDPALRDLRAERDAIELEMIRLGETVNKE